MNFLQQITSEIPSECFAQLEDKLQQSLTLVDSKNQQETLINQFSSLPLMLRKLKLPIIEKNNKALSLLDTLRIYWVYHTLHVINLNQWIKVADDEEKASLARGLVLLDDKGENIESIIELTRTNSLDLFSALTLNNAYPAKYFPELNFNQLVLKALFSKLNIALIVDLPARKNKELSRMTKDYEQELINANRPVPTSLILAI